MATDELRELRLSQQLPAKEMVAVVQRLYPKYDKTMQSKCERGDEYGIKIQPDALDALYSEFAPELREKRKRKKDGHRLTCRISCRIKDDEYKALQHRISEEGFKDMQSWLADMVRAYIKEGDAE